MSVAELGFEPGQSDFSLLDIQVAAVGKIHIFSPICIVFLLT